MTDLKRTTGSLYFLIRNLKLDNVDAACSKGVNTGRWWSRGLEGVNAKRWKDPRPDDGVVDKSDVPLSWGWTRVGDNGWGRELCVGDNPGSLCLSSPQSEIPDSLRREVWLFRVELPTLLLLKRESDRVVRE